MSHVFFFSYASENYDKELKAFFQDLCTEVAPYTAWKPEDSRVSFRDGKDLALMEGWRPSLLDALQTSAVFVCVTSIAYFQKPFCGQEYFVFDQRRRHALQDGDVVPQTILPVIWAPIDKPLPFADEIQLKTGGMSDIYKERGLRYLKKLDRDEYDKCVVEFALAIKNAWNSHKAPPVPPLPDVAPFGQIPNAFAGGQWEDAAGPGGWLPGPGVANFVFAAALNTDLKEARYGATPADWRPYLPPVATTIAEMAKAAAKKHSLRYREILVNDQLAVELHGARDRKNLTLLLADPRTLPIQQYQPIGAFDGLTWEGTSLLLLWDGAAGSWQQQEPVVTHTFPIRSQLKAPAYLGPVSSAGDLEKLLDTTLADLRSALTKAETEKKEKIDEGPAQLTGPTGAHL